MQREWLANGVKLFMAHPKLALLGGFRGRMDYGSSKRSSQVDGPKFGTRAVYIPSVRCCLPVTHTDPTTNLPFMFMYKVREIPRRSSRLRLWRVDGDALQRLRVGSFAPSSCSMLTR
jgi:hypothetical protein